jgi:hypothetical protein
MNTVLSTTVHDHPPHPVRTPVPPPVRRVGPLDRAALRLGVALITWGRRSLAADSRERLARRVELELARLERERSAQRWQGLNLPPR